MAKCIAFLRAVNVGGRFVKMERLRTLFEEVGLDGARTYIQSGNVFFEAPAKDRAALTKKIEAHLSKALGYEVSTFVRTVSEVEQALARQPFAKVKVTDATRLFVLFTSKPLPKGSVPMASPNGNIELLDATKGIAFVVVHRQEPGRAINASGFVEKQFPGMRTTGRFYATTEKIVAAAKGADG